MNSRKHSWRTRALITAIAAVGTLIAAGCGTHSSHPGAAHTALHKIVASASANPKLRHDEAVAQREVMHCITKIGMVHLALHPVKGLHAVIACAAPPSKQAAVQKCATKAVDKNGAGKGVLAKDEAAIAGCLVNP